MWKDENRSEANLFLSLFHCANQSAVQRICLNSLIKKKYSQNKVFFADIH